MKLIFDILVLLSLLMIIFYMLEKRKETTTGKDTDETKPPILISPISLNPEGKV